MWHYWGLWSEELVEWTQQSRDAKGKRAPDGFFLCATAGRRGATGITLDIIGVFQQVSRGNDNAATAYSHDHTLSLGSFTGREEQGHRVSHLPHKWLPLKVFHVFAIYSLVPIRRPVPRENRSICSSPRSPSGWTVALNSNRLHCRKRRQLHSWNPIFPGKTARAALPQDHLTSLEDSNNVQKMVVGEGLGTMGSQTENKQTAYNLWGLCGLERKHLTKACKPTVKILSKALKEFSLQKDGST